MAAKLAADTEADTEADTVADAEADTAADTVIILDSKERECYVSFNVVPGLSEYFIKFYYHHTLQEEKFV